MAKDAKKPKIPKKKVEEKPTPKPEVKRRVAPAIPQGLVSISMLPDDLETLTNFMSICARHFEEEALAAAKVNDENKYAILAARHKLSSMYANRFVEFMKMPEPESRDIH